MNLRYFSTNFICFVYINTYRRQYNNLFRINSQFQEHRANAKLPDFFRVLVYVFSGDTYECIFCGIRTGVINNQHALAYPSGDCHDIEHVNCYKCLEYGFCDRRMIGKSNFSPHIHTYIYMCEISAICRHSKIRKLDKKRI